MPDLINKAKKKNEQTLVDDSFTNGAKAQQTPDDITEEDIALKAAKQAVQTQAKTNAVVGGTNYTADRYAVDEPLYQAMGDTAAEEAGLNQQMADAAKEQDAYNKYAAALAELQAQNDTLNTQLSDSEAKYADLYNQLQSATTTPTTSNNYAEYVQSIIDNIVNPPEFSYDYTTDPLYQQYKQSYEQGAKLASENALAQGAMLTGGYSNSAAQIAAQQAGQQYMSQLNDVIPDLYNIAYNRYSDNLSNEYNKLSALSTLEQQAYERAKYEDETAYERKQDALNRADAQTEAKYDYEVALEKAKASAKTTDTETYIPTTTELNTIRSTLKDYQTAGDTKGIELLLLTLQAQGLNADIYANLVDEFLDEKVDTGAKTSTTDTTTDTKSETDTETKKSGGIDIEKNKTKYKTGEYGYIR